MFIVKRITMVSLEYSSRLVVPVLRKCSNMTSVGRPRVELSPETGVLGIITKTRDPTDRPVHAYLGIPYAESPVGPLRFKPPRPINLWTGVRDASKFGSACPQNLVLTNNALSRYPVPDRMSEDCLYLNVYTPANSRSGSRLPVMIWIHGGAFILGSSDSYEGTVLASRYDVIVVTINYRMGIFGFLATQDGHFGGNMGLMDQVEAMKWVQKYIANFGGDPENVTLFGESAGSISISLHMVSPMTTGLFHRAICESGTLFYPGVVWSQKNSDKFLRASLKSLGCQSFDGKGVEEFLSKISAKDLEPMYTRVFGKVIDGQYLTDDPIELYKRGQYHKVDLLCGFNTHEGYLFMGIFGGMKVTNKAQPMTFMEMSLRQTFLRGHPQANELINKVKDVYVPDVDQMTLDDVTQRCLNVFADCLFVAPTVFSAKLHSHNARVFMYEFAHRPCFSKYPSWVRSDHTEEMPYVFGEPFLGSETWPAVDQRVCSNVMTYWTNFAKTGDPNCDSLPTWPRFTLARSQYLRITAEPEADQDIRPRDMALWNDIILPRTQIHNERQLSHI